MKIQEIIKEISSLRKTKKKVLSNYYMNYQGSDIEFDVWKGLETIVFCVQEERLYRCFFATTDAEELNNILSELPPQTVIDYVTKEKSDAFPWEESGFKRLTTLARFTNADLNKERPKTKRERFLEQFYDEDCGGFATLDDLDDIYELLYKVFDYHVSRLPSKNDLAVMIEKKWVLLYREEKIIAFLMYQIEGKKYYGYQIYNEGTADITYNLECKAIRYAQQQYGIKSSYAWVEVDNSAANMRVGADFDGTYDYIFVKLEEKL